MAEIIPAAEPARATPDPAPLRAVFVTNQVPQCVLLVEDNLIVALDTEEHLLSLGVIAVNLATTCEAALASVADTPPDFALLDYNLGEETSGPVADALEVCGVPFAFATGYGEVHAVIAKYSHPVGVLHKPYSKDDLAQILVQSFVT